MFEVFSESGSLSLFDVQNPQDSINNLQLGENSSCNNSGIQEVGDDEEDIGDDGAMPPALKRMFLLDTAETRSSTKSTKAKESLQTQNLPYSICQLISDLLDAETGNTFMSDTALVSLGEARDELIQMSSHP